MAFFRHKDGICRNYNGEGAVKVAKRKYPPGYVDPEWIQLRQIYYLKKWEAQGKPPTQFRHCLALAIARHQYYSPPMPRNRLSTRKRNGRHFWRTRTPEQQEAIRERMRRAQKISQQVN